MTEFIPVQRRKSKKVTRPKEHVKSNPEECADHYNQMVRFYKTEKCREGFGKPFPFCPQGKQCFYAHSEAEQRRDPLVERGVERYSRGMCQQRLNCPNGKDCPYAHNDCETMYHPKTYKTKPCNRGSKCERGVFCAFQHDDDILSSELRGELFLNRDSRSGSFSTDSVDGIGMTASSPHLSNSIEMSAFAPSGFDGVLSKEYSVENVDLLAPGDRPDKEGEEEEDSKREDLNGFSSALPGMNNELQRRQKVALEEAIRIHKTQEKEIAKMKHQQVQMQKQMEELRQNHQQQGTLQGSTTNPLDSASLPQATSPTLNSNRMKSASVVIAMLRPGLKLLPEQAEALLDLLACSEEGRISRDPQENTALLHAVSRGLHHLVPFLSNAQTINARNAHGQWPVSIAVAGDDHTMLEELIKCGADLNIGEGAFITAIKSSAFQCAFVLLKSSSTNFMAKDAMGNSGLILAAERGLKQIVLYLCSHHNALINNRNNNGETALALAARNGHLAVVLVLIEAGADPNIPDINRTTPLMMAAASDIGSQCATVLLRLPQVDVDARNLSNLTAISIANQRGDTELARKLVERGATTSEAPIAASPSPFTADASPLAQSLPQLPVSSELKDSILPASFHQPTQTSILGTNNAFASAFSHALQQPQQRQQQLCLICMLARPTVQNRPCNHVALCEPCAKKWFATPNYCPLCSGYVENFVMQSPPLVNGNLTS